MKKALIPAAMVALFMSASAFAGPGGTTCATAEQIFPASTVSGDTSGAGYTNNTNTYGAVPSPANDAYYYFIANGVPTSSVITANFSYDGFIALTGGCGNNASPYIGGQGGTGTQTLSLSTPGALTDGTKYYIIISGNPNAGAGANGGFSLDTPDPLPVKLQSFSAD